MERITFDQSPEMVSLILEKLERIERLIGSTDSSGNHIDKEMLSVEGAAKFMGVSKSRVYKMSFNRDLPIYKPTGGRIYFKRDDLVDYLKHNRLMSKKEIEQEAVNHIVHHPIKRKAQRFPMPLLCCMSIN